MPGARIPGQEKINIVIAIILLADYSGMQIYKQDNITEYSVYYDRRNTAKNDSIQKGFLTFS